MRITKLIAREILDSRGNPTIEVTTYLENGIQGVASVPSGASTGSKEAIELRDMDPKRYNGKGVLRAVENVNTLINNCIKGLEVTKQKNIDEALINLDGTKNKNNLGANAILGVSLSVAHAAANYLKIPLFRHLNDQENYIMPIPLMNIINGGAHADNNIDIQEFMIMPISASAMKDAVRMGAEIFHALKSILASKFLSTNVGDEGGFAPQLENAESAIEYIIKAIEMVGLKAGKDIALALDVAATEFYKDGFYLLSSQKLKSEQLIDYYSKLINSYPIISIEDPMAEQDYQGWQAITKQLGKKVQLVGDDLFVTNKKILQKGIEMKEANAILIKPNQIGTLTETFAAINTACKAGYRSIISHRSGETEDTTIAHIAVASNCGQIKTGSLCRTDRVAKYNELLRIEEKLGKNANYSKLSCKSQDLI